MPIDLDPPPAADDLLNLVEELKAGLVAYCATSQGTWEDAEYKRIRKVLLLHPQLESLLPDYIRKFRTLGEFWPYIKDKFSTYAERRAFLAETLGPLLDHVEKTNIAGLSSDYEQGDLIGHGGFGVVYRTHHRLLKMDFAVKYFAPAFERTGGDGGLERFFQEARMLFGLRHRSIVQIYNVGMVLRCKPAGAVGRPSLQVDWRGGLCASRGGTSGERPEGRGGGPAA